MRRLASTASPTRTSVTLSTMRSPLRTPEKIRPLAHHRPGSSRESVGGGGSRHGRGCAVGDPCDAHARPVQEANRVVSKDRVYGHTRAGKPITEKEIEALAAEAESGYDVDTLLARRGKRGRPALGSAPASVESVRLDPELRDQLLERAKAEHTTTSEVIREALRRFLKAA